MPEAVRFQLPKITPDSLPGLVRPVGMFGSYSDRRRRKGGDAEIPALEDYLYRLHPGV
jgi:hypothetical protein